MATMRLELSLDLDHELIRLGQVIPWDRLAAEFGPLYCSDNGRPGVPIRLVAGLHFLKHLKGLSDEQTVRGWVENPYWQFFYGEEYFQRRLPIDPSQMTRWRKRIGEAGIEKLFQATIEGGKSTRTITERSLDKVTVDTTVQSSIRRTRACAGRCTGPCCGSRKPRASGFARATGIWRSGPSASTGGTPRPSNSSAKRVLKALKTMAGRVFRDVDRKLSDAGWERHRGPMFLSHFILRQTRKSKWKIYSLHASEVECIAKGKAHRPYEFGVKVSLGVTHREGFVVGIQTCAENPYDGHTLEDQFDQVERLTGKAPKQAFVDNGYKGHPVLADRCRGMFSGTRRLSTLLKRNLRRRSAIEPEIGHMKAEGLLGRNFLKGVKSDAMNALLCGASHNLRKVLARIRALLCLLGREARKAMEEIIGFLESFGSTHEVVEAA